MKICKTCKHIFDKSLYATILKQQGSYFRSLCICLNRNVISVYSQVFSLSLMCFESILYEPWSSGRSQQKVQEPACRLDVCGFEEPQALLGLQVQ